jgi:hypothetical protein
MAPPAFAVMVSSGSCDTLGALLEESASLSASAQWTLPPTVVLRELGSHGKSLVAASMLPAAAAVIEAEAPLLKVCHADQRPPGSYSTCCPVRRGVLTTRCKFVRENTRCTCRGRWARSCERTLRRSGPRRGFALTPPPTYPPVVWCWRSSVAPRAKTPAQLITGCVQGVDVATIRIPAPNAGSTPLLPALQRDYSGRSMGYVAQLRFQPDPPLAEPCLPNMQEMAERMVTEALALPDVAKTLAAHEASELVEVYLCWVFNR